ncbi:hypothetical protein C1H46_026048 [Malus baccata]|uniref:Uncharacterized protein n=1 Tax=Malus baccata TaxID=106549 RepID=A0A540LPZ4_MALBA|nr:hypothetical protein C1H46_026048 [Malus baccata]
MPQCGTPQTRAPIRVFLRSLSPEPAPLPRPLWRMWRILRWWSERRWRMSRELLERMANNDKMERSTEGAGHFGKENLIPDGAFSPESKYYLLLGNPIPTISVIEFLILHGPAKLFIPLKLVNR